MIQDRTTGITENDIEGCATLDELLELIWKLESSYNRLVTKINLIKRREGLDTQVPTKIYGMNKQRDILESLIEQARRQQDLFADTHFFNARFVAEAQRLLHPHVFANIQSKAYTNC